MFQSRLDGRIVFVKVARNHEDRNAGLGIPNVLDQFQTIHVRQFRVEQSQAEPVGSDYLKRRLTFERPDALQAKTPEHVIESPANIGVVIDDEYGLTRQAYSSSFFPMGHNGSFTVNMLPLPLSLSTPIEPPC